MDLPEPPYARKWTPEEREQFYAGKRGKMTLDALQYSDDRRLPMKLYLLAKDGHHRGGKWFMHVPEYPEEGEITLEDARKMAEDHMAHGQEVRICDGGDMLVFHSKDGKMVHPTSGTASEFWSSLK